MGFRVFLYREHMYSALDQAQIDQALLALPHTKRTAQDIKEYTCTHPATGESFVFAVSRSTAAAYQTYASGPTIDFCIEYSTSKPVVEDAVSALFHLCARLKTKIHITCEPRGYSEPETPTALVSSFIRNQERSATAAAGTRLALEEAKVTREKMDHCHSFLLRRNIIEDSVHGTGVHVPEQIFLLRPPTSHSVVQVITWPDCHPMVFPEVDYICIERDKKGLFGLAVGREQGLAPFAKVIKLLGSDLLKREEPMLHYVYSRPTPRPEIKKELDKLPLMSVDSYQEPPPECLVEV
jgi:hypothetical protein